MHMMYTFLEGVISFSLGTSKGAPHPNPNKIYLNPIKLSQTHPEPNWIHTRSAKSGPIISEFN